MLINNRCLFEYDSIDSIDLISLECFNRLYFVWLHVQTQYTYTDGDTLQLCKYTLGIVSELYEYKGKKKKQNLTEKCRGLSTKKWFYWAHFQLGLLSARRNTWQKPSTHKLHITPPHTHTHIYSHIHTFTNTINIKRNYTNKYQCLSFDQQITVMMYLCIQFICVECIFGLMFSILLVSRLDSYVAWS